MEIYLKNKRMIKWIENYLNKSKSSEELPVRRFWQGEEYEKVEGGWSPIIKGDITRVIDPTRPKKEVMKKGGDVVEGAAPQEVVREGALLEKNLPIDPTTLGGDQEISLSESEEIDPDVEISVEEKTNNKKENE